MSIVNIPAPCPEKVSAMERAGDGFFCQSCSHVVVDFTQMSDAEVVAYLQSGNGQRTCGHFRNDQVKRRSDWPFEMVRFVASIVLAFGSLLFISSCTTSGESIDKKKADSTAFADSLAKNDYTTGIILCDPGQLDSIPVVVDTTIEVNLDGEKQSR